MDGGRKERRKKNDQRRGQRFGWEAERETGNRNQEKRRRNLGPTHRRLPETRENEPGGRERERVGQRGEGLWRRRKGDGERKEQGTRETHCTARRRTKEKQETNGTAWRERESQAKQRERERSRDRLGVRNNRTKNKEYQAIKTLYTNSQSVQNKIHELEALAEDFQPDLILLTETWCNDNISDAALSLHGYSLETDLRRDRQDTRNGVGGGLLVYSRKGMKILPLDINNNFNQFCSFSTGTKRDSLNFVLAYRPPSSGTENTNKLCELMRELPMNSVIIGDINMPGINWETMTSDNKGRALVETMEEEGMAQLVNFSTHIKGNILEIFARK